MSTGDNCHLLDRRHVDCMTFTIPPSNWELETVDTFDKTTGAPSSDFRKEYGMSLPDEDRNP